MNCFNCLSQWTDPFVPVLVTFFLSMTVITVDLRLLSTLSLNYVVHFNRNALLNEYFTSGGLFQVVFFAIYTFSTLWERLECCLRLLVFICEHCCVTEHPPLRFVLDTVRVGSICRSLSWVHCLPHAAEALLCYLDMECLSFRSPYFSSRSGASAEPDTRHIYLCYTLTL